MPTKVAPIVSMLLALLSLWPSSGQAQFEELITKAPTSANTLFLLNVEKILQSPAAIAGDWKSKAQAAYASGVTILPPNAKQAILAAHFDLQSMTPIWEAAVMNLREEPSLAIFAKSSNGALGKVDDNAIVALPGDAYLVQFAPKIVGAFSPASRQTIARWLRQARSGNKPELAPYLLEAYRYSQDLKTPIVLALDLEDAISHEHIRAAIADSETLSKTKVDVEKAVTFLSGIRGITLGVTLQDKPFGKIRIDFRSPVTVAPELAKTLVIESLSNHGAMLNEIYSWKPSVEGNTFFLEGDLDQGGLRRIFSLFDRPPALPSKEGEMKPQVAAQRPDQAEIEATKAYLRNIEDMLEDLRKKPRENPNYTVGQTGVWYDTYARKIDRLTTLYVDEEAAQFGMRASENLRSASQAIRNGAAQGRIAVTSLPRQYNTYTQNDIYGYAYRWNWYTGGGMVPYGSQYTYNVEDVSAEIAARTQAKTQSRLTSMNQARDLIDQVNNDLATTRKRMTAKYNAAF